MKNYSKNQLQHYEDSLQLSGYKKKLTYKPTATD